MRRGVNFRLWNYGNIFNSKFKKKCKQIFAVSKKVKVFLYAEYLNNHLETWRSEQGLDGRGIITCMMEMETNFVIGGIWGTGQESTGRVLYFSLSLCFIHSWAESKIKVHKVKILNPAVRSRALETISTQGLFRPFLFLITEHCLTL